MDIRGHPNGPGIILHLFLSLVYHLEIFSRKISSPTGLSLNSTKWPHFEYYFCRLPPHFEITYKATNIAWNGNALLLMHSATCHRVICHLFLKLYFQFLNISDESDHLKRRLFARRSCCRIYFQNFWIKIESSLGAVFSSPPPHPPTASFLTTLKRIIVKYSFCVPRYHHQSL